MFPRERLAWAERAAGRCQAGVCCPAEKGWCMRGGAGLLSAFLTARTDKDLTDLNSTAAYFQINLKTI